MTHAPSPAAPSGADQGARPGARGALSLATISFMGAFAVWTIFSIIGIKIKKDLGLTDAEFGLLAGTPILTGSLTRVVLGVMADRFGGRIVNLIVMLLAAASTVALSFAHTYPMMLLAALGLGLAGGSFAAGVAYVSKFFPKEKQGAALGVYGAGNVGAAITNFGAPFVMAAVGWENVARIWAAALVVLALVFFFGAKDEPELASRRAAKTKAPPFLAQFAPLTKLQVWRFSLYYFFNFGAFVALSLWLPRYLVGVYHVDLKTAGVLAACFSLPAAAFRIFGGWLADRIGARRVMYTTFSVAIIATFLLSYPATSYVVDGIKGPIAFRIATSLPVFMGILITLGFFMSLGMAAVFKHIPVYYPKDIGAVGGLVGMIGGLGGFVLPIAFGAMNDIVHVWTSCFMLLFVLVATALTWMTFAIRHMERTRTPELERLPELPEMVDLHPAEPTAAPASPQPSARRRGATPKIAAE
ncbi:MFS transporter [Phenylobacterium soli]|uniref:MFS transporter n=1 Tax=Phenylobacterium soli TaxID=2170551 RepID=A0A328ANU9_9CAUL|nr:nitrate/nitrite transporter [Phenylobacterium soli]RAK55154.1 MFS transporter [Phenylobacterium soli]